MRSLQTVKAPNYQNEGPGVLGQANIVFADPFLFFYYSDRQVNARRLLVFRWERGTRVLQLAYDFSHHQLKALGVTALSAHHACAVGRDYLVLGAYSGNQSAALVINLSDSLQRGILSGYVIQHGNLPSRFYLSIGSSLGAAYLANGRTEGVSVYELGSGAANLACSIQNPYPPQRGSDSFGLSAVKRDAQVWIGSPNNDTQAEDAGIVYGYDANGSQLTFNGMLNIVPAADSGFSSRFGHAMACHGDIIAVSAPAQITSWASPTGAVHIYDVQSGTPTHLGMIEPRVVEVPHSLSFGSVVTFAGDSLLVLQPLTGRIVNDATGESSNLHRIDSNPRSPAFKGFLGTYVLQDSKQLQNSISSVVALDENTCVLLEGIGEHTRTGTPIRTYWQLDVVSFT